MYPAGQQILIIDDDARRRAVSERVLSEAGFAVTTVSEGFSAIRAAGSRRVALAIAAVELPGVLDGRSTVRQIRTRQPWLKALFTGAAAGRQWRRNRDCDDFIASPFDQRDLLGCVFELLQRDIGGGHADHNRAG
jgi:two-component system, OmpR family, phosphate regulon response regulator OmpR